MLSIESNVLDKFSYSKLVPSWPYSNDLQHCVNRIQSETLLSKLHVENINKSLWLLHFSMSQSPSPGIPLEGFHPGITKQNLSWMLSMAFSSFRMVCCWSSTVVWRFEIDACMLERVSLLFDLSSVWEWWDDLQECQPVITLSLSATSFCSWSIASSSSFSLICDTSLSFTTAITCDENKLQGKNRIQAFRSLTISYTCWVLNIFV